MERERRQWEREQAEELDKPLGPVHYQEMRQGGTERQLINDDGQCYTLIIPCTCSVSFRE